MNLPIDVPIKSNRRYIGSLIVLYKRLVGFFIKPFLRNVFTAQNQMIEDRFREIDERIQGLEMRLNQQLDETAKDILDRTDALFMVLDQRQETLNSRIQRNYVMDTKINEQNELTEELASLKDRFELMLVELADPSTRTVGSRAPVLSLRVL